MEQIPSWETNRFSGSQDICCILWNPKVYYCMYKSPPSLPFLSQIIPFHAPSPNFLKTQFNILPSMRSYSNWALSQIIKPLVMWFSPFPSHFWMVHSMISFYSEEFLATCPTAKLGTTPFWLCDFIQYICSYRAYWRLLLHPQLEDLPCLSDRDPPWNLWLNTV